MTEGALGQAHRAVMDLLCVSSSFTALGEAREIE